MVKSVENEWLRNNWERTPYNVLGVRHTARVFNMVCAGACECYRTTFPSRPGTLPFLHITWFSRVSTWHTTTKLGGNAYQKERIPLLHFKWPNHAKVIKATTHERCWWKVPIPTGNVSLITCILINEERQITTFRKVLSH